MSIDNENIISDHSWILERDQHCILSPDSDGFLCGLLLSNLLNWNISGFYDGKILVLGNGLEMRDCVFLDMDINRQNIKSIGHHIVQYNKRITHPNMRYSCCIQPNQMRNFDAKIDFQKKYPFGTIHLLLGIVQAAGLIRRLPKDSLWPLLFTDGVWNNLFGYTENCLDWIRYLAIDEESHILHKIFCSNDQSVYSIMKGLDDFLRLRDHHNAQGVFEDNDYHPGGRNKRTGDKLRLTNSRGEVINMFSNDQSLYAIHENEKSRIQQFVSEIGSMCEFHYIPDKWRWDGFWIQMYQKGILTGLNNTKVIELLDKNPLSMAVTSGTDIEYTLETQ